MATMEDAKKYIRRIRNVKKREYAEKYLLFLTGRGEQPEYDFGCMAAQGVRLTLGRMFEPPDDGQEGYYISGQGFMNV